MAGSFSWQSSYLGFGWSLQCLGWATSHWQHVPLSWWRLFWEPYQVEVDFFGGKINFTKTRVPPLEADFFQGVPLSEILHSQDDPHFLGCVFVGDFFTDWDPMGWKSVWKTTMRENIFGSLFPNHQIQAKNAMFPHQTSPSKSKCYALFFRSISFPRNVLLVSLRFGEKIASLSDVCSQALKPPTLGWQRSMPHWYLSFQDLSNRPFEHTSWVINHENIPFNFEGAYSYLNINICYWLVFWSIFWANVGGLMVFSLSKKKHWEFLQYRSVCKNYKIKKKDWFGILCYEGLLVFTCVCEIKLWVQDISRPSTKKKRNLISETFYISMLLFV